jgi:hypothetical protein
MIVGRFIDWMNVQPVIVLLMSIASLILFYTTYSRPGEAITTFWAWLKRFTESAIVTLLFLGLLWGFRTILNSNMSTFYSTHGSLSDLSRDSAQSIWGRPHYQGELNVMHYIRRMVKQEIPQEDPTKPPIYKDVEIREEVPENSVQSFKGDVNMTLSNREKGYAYYSGFIIDTKFVYDMINDSDMETEAEFDFPLSPNQTMHENFSIQMDGRDISQQVQYTGDNVHWMVKMQPQQKSTIEVAYTSRGMDTFTYQITNRREIKAFELTLTIDRLPVSLLNYPNGALTPTEVKATPDGLGSVLTWRLDRAITSAGMGVALITPEQPGAKVLQVLVNSAYGITLLLAVLCLTLLIRGEKVNFLDLALISGVYSIYYMVMASVSDYLFGFWGSLILGTLLTGVLTFLLYRRLESKLLRNLIYGIVGFFTIVYPLSGLLTQMAERNTFDGLVQIGLIIYLFFLSLYTRVERSRQIQKSE